MYATNAKTKSAIVKYDYNGGADNQLSIKKGEEIEVIGDATAEGWILARKGNGDEGYIPDKYFDIQKSSGRPTGGPPRPPPAATNIPSRTASPVTTSSQPAYAGGNNNNKQRVNSGSSRGSASGAVLQQGDEYALFAYQYEWWSILTLFTGGILNFLYSTTLPDDERVLYIFIAIMAVLVTCVLLCIVSIFRYSCDMCGMGTTGLRIALYIFNAALLTPLPVGITVVSIGVIAAVIEFETKRRDVSEIPEAIRDEWGKQIFGGGFGNCSLGKLIIAFTILAVAIASLGYGFANGYNYAVDETERVSTEYYLNPEITGLMFGFGRVITISFVLLLIFSMFGCCSRQQRKIQNGGNGGNKVINDACSDILEAIYGDVEQRRFIHRVFGYCIVFSVFWHCIFAYYCYEDSSSTHSFYDIYGWWILVTGSLCLLLMGVIVASANDNVCDQSPRLFTISHKFCSIALIIVLIIHGNQTQIVGQYFWIFIITPFIFYLCDAMYRYARDDD